MLQKTEDSLSYRSSFIIFKISQVYLYINFIHFCLTVHKKKTNKNQIGMVSSYKVTLKIKTKNFDSKVSNIETTL